MGTNIAACQKQQLYEGSITTLNPQITISRETQWVSRGVSIHVGICSQHGGYNTPKLVLKRKTETINDAGSTCVSVKPRVDWVGSV